MGSLGIGAWIIALLFGLRFLKTAVYAAGATQGGPLVIWSFVFALVTLQMTTSLRPILGRADQPFTQEKKFFLQHWGEWFGKYQPTPTAGTGREVQSDGRGPDRLIGSGSDSSEER